MALRATGWGVGRVPGPEGSKWLHGIFFWASEGLPRGSNYPRLKDSGPKNPLQVWLLGPETSNIGYLEPLGSTIVTSVWALRRY